MKKFVFNLHMRYLSLTVVSSLYKFIGIYFLMLMYVHITTLIYLLDGERMLHGQFHHDSIPP